MEPFFRAGGALVITLVAAVIIVPRISKGYNLSRRAKIGAWTGSVALLLWSLLAFIPIYPRHLQMALLPSEVLLGFVAEEVWMFFGGLGVGVLFALFLVGTFSKRHDSRS
jgi:hypothetical protein